MPFFRSRNQPDDTNEATMPTQPPPAYGQNCYADGHEYAGNYPHPNDNAYTQGYQGPPGTTEDERQLLSDNNNNNNNAYAPHEQDEDLPTDLGDLQDIFSFEFMRGRPIWNFILAILWCIGLPILLYHILRPHLGQVLAMVVASAPPLLIVVLRMLREKRFDPLGLVAGISFLISGIVSIAEPDEKTEAICESIVPLLVGVICVVSIIPIKIGSWEMRPLVFQVTNQIMPRTDSDEELAANDDARLYKKQHHPHMAKKQKLDWAYRHLARFRRDMRVMTFSWGLMLIVGFFIKLIIVLTGIDTGSAELAGFLIFGLGSFLMLCFTWFYTKVVRGHIANDLAFWKEQNEPRPLDGRSEALQNANWGMQTMGNAFGQVIG